MARTASRGQGTTAGLALAALQADRNGKLPAMVGFLRGDELQAMFPLSVRRRRQTGKIDTRSLVRTWEREEICALARWLGLSEDRGRVLEDVTAATRPRRFIWHGRSSFPRRDRVVAWARLVPRTGLARDGGVATKLELRRARVRRPPLLQLCESKPLRRSKAPPRRLSRTEALANELKLSRDQLAKANERLILLLPEAAKATVAPPVDDRTKAAAIATVAEWFDFKRMVVAMGRLALHAQLERNRVQVRAWVRLAAARRLARHLYRKCVVFSMHAAVHAWKLEVRRRSASEAAVTLQRCARYFLARCRCHKVRRRKATSLAALRIQCATRRLLVRRRCTARQTAAALTVQRFAWSVLHLAERRQREQRAQQRANTLASLQIQCAARRMLVQHYYCEILTKRRHAVLTMQRSARAALKCSEQRRKDYCAHQWDNAVPVIQRFVRNVYLPQRRKSFIEARKWEHAILAASTIQDRVRTRRLAVRRANAAVMIQRQCRGCLLRTSVDGKRNATYQAKMQIETRWPAATPLFAAESTLPMVPFVPLEAPVPCALSPSNSETDCPCAEGDATQLNPPSEVAVEEAAASVIHIHSTAWGNATRATHRRSTASLHELQRAATLALLQGGKLKRQLAEAASTSAIARKFVHSYERRRAAAARNVQRVYRRSKARASILYTRVTAIKNVQRIVRGHQARTAAHQLHDIVSVLQERTRGSFARGKIITRLRASTAYNRVVTGVYATARQVHFQKSSHTADRNLAAPSICGRPSYPRTSHDHVQWRDVATMTYLVKMKNSATQPIGDYYDNTIKFVDAHNTIAKRLQPVAQIWLARRELDLRRRDRAAQDAVASFVSDLIFPKQTADSWTSPTADTGIDSQVTRSCTTQTDATKTVEQKDQEPQCENVAIYSATQPASLVAAQIDGYWEMRDAYVTAQNSTYGRQSTIIQHAWRTCLGRRKSCALIHGLGRHHILARNTIKPVCATVIVQSALQKGAAFEVARLKVSRIEALDKAGIEHRAAAAIQARARGVHERSVLRDQNFYERRLPILAVRNHVRRAEAVTVIQRWTRQVQARQIAPHLPQEWLTLEGMIEKERVLKAANVVQCWTRQIQAHQVARHMRQESLKLEKMMEKKRELEAATVMQRSTRQVQAHQAARHLRQERRTHEKMLMKKRRFKAAIVVQCWTRQIQARQVSRLMLQKRRSLEDTIKKEREYEAATVIQSSTRQVQARQIARHLHQARRRLEDATEKKRECEAATVIQSCIRQVHTRKVARQLREERRMLEDTIKKEREYEAATVIQSITRQVQARQTARHLHQERRRLEDTTEKERECEAATFIQSFIRQVHTRKVARQLREERRMLEEIIEKAREVEAAIGIQCWTRQVQARQVARHLRQERRTLEETIEKEREYEAALDKMKRHLELELLAMRIQNGFRRYMARCRLEQKVRALVEAEQIKIRAHRFTSAGRIQALARGVCQRVHFARDKDHLRDAKTIRAALLRMQARSKAEIERIEARLKHLDSFGPSEYLWSSVRAELGKQSSMSQPDSNSEEQLAETAHDTSYFGGDDQPSSFYGWIQQYDDSAQATYWYNTITGEASWLEPTEHQQGTYALYEPTSYYTQETSMVNSGHNYIGAGEVDAPLSDYYDQPNTAAADYGTVEGQQWLPQPQEYATATGASYLNDGAATQATQHVVSSDYYNMHT